MCGRLRREWDEKEIPKEWFTQMEIAIELDRIKPLYKPTYNAAPGQHHPVIVQNRDGENIIRLMRWGLVRPGATKGTPKPIDARAETILRKELFRDLVPGRRCIVPVSGYYEWRTEDGRRVPYSIRSADGRLLWIAGLYDAWTNGDGTTTETYCVITTTPSPEIAHIHDRMPVLLQSRDDQFRWLDRKERDLSRIMPLLRPYPGERLTYWAVSDLVNNVRNDGRELILPRSESLEPAPRMATIEPVNLALPLAS